MQPRALSENDRIVLSMLGEAGRPLSAYDILAKTRSEYIKAPTQVYRSLQKLEDRGLIHKIEALSAFVACSDRQADHHQPGFVICRSCGSVREFEDSRVPAIAQDAAGPAFAIDTIALEIFGACGDCQEGAPTEPSGAR